MNYYQSPIEEIFQKFSSSPKGLSNHQALFRINKYGFNRIKKVRKPP